MIKPDELRYLEASRRCLGCDHLEALHWDNRDGDAGLNCHCCIPECPCEDFVKPDGVPVPVGFEQELSGYGPVLFDGWCGEPVAWGFEIKRHLGEERFAALHRYGKLECVDRKRSVWALVVKWLTAEEAIAKYGAMSDLELGPRGGFRKVTYGTKTFLSRHVAP